MNRRKTIKNLLLSSGTFVALPVWAREWTPEQVSMESSFLSTEEESMMTAIVDAILPAGEKGVGGVKVGVDKFLIKLFDRCYDEDVQENVRVQMDNLQSKANSMFGKSFSNSDLAQRVGLLNRCGNSENEAEKSFFDLIKSEGIRGFRTSREVMTRHYKYRVAPGHYNGCVDVEV